MIKTKTLAKTKAKAKTKTVTKTKTITKTFFLIYLACKYQSTKKLFLKVTFY